MKTIILCLVGPSGCGKTTLSLFLHRTFTRVNTIVSSTTRPMRNGEKNGREHWFTPKSQVPSEKWRLAYTVFGGYEYWAETLQARRGCINVYVIDEAGVNWLRGRYGDIYDILVCRIYRPSIENDIEESRIIRDSERVELNQPAEYFLENDGTLEDMYQKMSRSIIKLLVTLEAKEHAEYEG